MKSASAMEVPEERSLALKPHLELVRRHCFPLAGGALKPEMLLRMETKIPSDSDHKSPLPGLETGVGICPHSHCQCPGRDQHLISYTCERKKSMAERA